MASGVTLKMREIKREWRQVTSFWDRQDRDRTLAGKKRIKARRKK